MSILWLGVENYFINLSVLEEYLDLFSLTYKRLNGILLAHRLSFTIDEFFSREWPFCFIYNLVGANPPLAVVFITSLPLDNALKALNYVVIYQTTKGKLLISYAFVSLMAIDVDFA